MAFSWGNYDALTEEAESSRSRALAKGVAPLPHASSVSALEGAAASPSSLVTGLGLGPPAPSSALSREEPQPGAAATAAPGSPRLSWGLGRPPY